jgi:hypothetical protein
VTNLRTPQDLAQELSKPGLLYVAMPETRYRALPEALRENLTLLSTFKSPSALYRENDATASITHLEALHH